MRISPFSEIVLLDFVYGLSIQFPKKNWRRFGPFGLTRDNLFHTSNNVFVEANFHTQRLHFGKEMCSNCWKIFRIYSRCKSILIVKFFTGPTFSSKTWQVSLQSIISRVNGKSRSLCRIFDVFRTTIEAFFSDEGI